MGRLNNLYIYRGSYIRVLVCTYVACTFPRMNGFMEIIVRTVYIYKYMCTIRLLVVNCAGLH